MQWLCVAHACISHRVWACARRCLCRPGGGLPGPCAFHIAPSGALVRPPPPAMRASSRPRSSDCRRRVCRPEAVFDWDLSDDGGSDMSLWPHRWQLDDSAWMEWQGWSSFWDFPTPAASDGPRTRGTPRAARPSQHKAERPPRRQRCQGPPRSAFRQRWCVEDFVCA